MTQLDPNLLLEALIPTAIVSSKTPHLMSDR